MVVAGRRGGGAVTASRARHVLTPEHVEVRLVPAGPGSRFLALIVDSTFALAISAALYRLLVPELSGGIGYAVWATLNFVLGWGYHVYFETARRGQSPGKRLLGLRVVDGRGLPLALEQSFVRNVIRVLDLAPVFYGLGAAAIGVDRHRRRLGDLAADTMVVRESAMEAETASIARAPQFNSLRTPRVIRAIRHRISLEERELLLALSLRSGGLTPQARFDLFEAVAAHYRQKLELPEMGLSGENLVRGLVGVLFWDRRASSRPRRTA
jgi:uncharacterized RDD family membrane protein YckC